MALAEKVGRDFTVSPDGIELFGLSGSWHSNAWVIGICLGNKTDENGYLPYVSTVVDKAPARAYVEEIIKEDMRNGNLDKVKQLLISSRVAVRLFLDGTISSKHFQSAEEGEMDISHILGEDEEKIVRTITLPSVHFSMYTLPICIINELHIGSRTACSLDSNDRIV